MANYGQLMVVDDLGERDVKMEAALAEMQAFEGFQAAAEHILANPMHPLYRESWGHVYEGLKVRDYMHLNHFFNDPPHDKPFGNVIAEALLHRNRDSVRAHLAQLIELQDRRAQRAKDHVQHEALKHLMQRQQQLMIQGRAIERIWYDEAADIHAIYEAASDLNNPRPGAPAPAPTIPSWYRKTALPLFDLQDQVERDEYCCDECGSTRIARYPAQAMIWPADIAGYPGHVEPEIEEDEYGPLRSRTVRFK